MPVKQKDIEKRKQEVARAQCEVERCLGYKFLDYFGV